MKTRISLVGWLLLFVCLLMIAPAVSGAREPVSMARLQYRGGGDWYNNPDVIPNLMEYVEATSGIPTENSQTVVEATDEELFNHPILYITGHGNISLSEEDVRALRNYCLSGGFIYADDDYGMDEAFRREINKVFPDRALRRITPDHDLYDRYYSFDQLPRIHEHDPEQSPAAYGIRAGGEWVLLYTYNTNISDGWASPEVHGDPPEVRETALKFGLNIVTWVFSQ